MDSWLLWVFLILITWFSGWIPSLALIILQRRVKPILPSFLCIACQSGIKCARCRAYLEKMKWGARFLFLCISFIGLTQIIGIERVVFICFLFTLTLISVTDIWSKLIPNVITCSAASLFLFLRFFIHMSPIYNYVLTAIVGMMTLFFLGWLTNGIGGGDAKLFAVCGLVLGWPYMIMAFWLATMSALLYVGLRVLFCPVTRKESIPFGPHLFIGCYISYVWGNGILQVYIQAISFR